MVKGTHSKEWRLITDQHCKKHIDNLTKKMALTHTQPTQNTRVLYSNEN